MWGVAGGEWGRGEVGRCQDSGGSYVVSNTGRRTNQMQITMMERNTTMTRTGACRATRRFYRLVGPIQVVDGRIASIALVRKRRP
jgi:hypothetical protein